MLGVTWPHAVGLHDQHTSAREFVSWPLLNQCCYFSLVMHTCDCKCLALPFWARVLVLLALLGQGLVVACPAGPGFSMSVHGLLASVHYNGLACWIPI